MAVGGATGVSATGGTVAVDPGVLVVTRTGVGEGGWGARVAGAPVTWGMRPPGVTEGAEV
ncbi:MAG: hypothetical protein Fur0018_11590 [Anaerolineales bacterium]